MNQPNAEKVVNITWGADVPLPVAGRYIIVNANSHKVLEVPGASTANGRVLDQFAYTGALNQQWDVYPLPERFGGDCSYFTLKAAHDGVTADLNAWSYDNGDVIQQWAGGTNTLEQWYFQYVTNGYFKIRNRWSDKVMSVSGASLNNSAQIVQWDDTGSPDQQWRLIPAPISTCDFIAPAAPASLQATANAASVRLDWKANSETDLAGYTVLRSAQAGGPYEIVARGLTNNFFTDKSANLRQNYFYVVRAVDRSLNASANSSEAVATPGGGPTLLARYHFDGDTSDTSGNANDPIVTAVSPGFVSGKYGSALNFDGASQYLMLPANFLAGATNFTVAMWVYWNGGNAWQRIFDFGNDTTQYMFLTPSSGNTTLRFAITTNGATSEQILETAALPSGQWRHIAISRNGNVARLYVNGVAVKTGSLTISPAGFNPALNYLGDSQYPADPLFNGDLDEVYVYNYALSDLEISRLAANQPPPPLVPTQLATSVAGNTLQMSWPTNYLGYRLESNSVSLSASGQWFTVSGSSTTNQMRLPLGSETNVFFRLVYP